MADKIKYYQPQAQKFNKAPPTHGMPQNPSGQDGPETSPIDSVSHSSNMVADYFPPGIGGNSGVIPQPFDHAIIMPSDPMSDHFRTSNEHSQALIVRPPNSIPKPTQTSRRGKKRTPGLRGEIVEIPNELRDRAVAEMRAKRARYEGNEPIEEPVEVKVEIDPYGPHVERRGRYACDQCFYRKTKCCRRVDGKPPSDSYPCDFCVQTGIVCSTHFANSERPDSINALDENYKRYRFPNILNDGVELENLALRQKLAGLQEKIDAHESSREAEERVHKAILAQLDAVAKHNNTLEKQNRALERNNIELNTLVEKLRSARRPTQSSPVVEQQQNTGMEFDNLLSDQAPTGEESSNQEDLVEDEPVLANPVEPQSVVESNEIGRSEVFQGLRSCELRCNDINLANACLNAYFANVHPVIPVLHRDAFYSLYQLYGQKALYKQALTIRDGSTKEGRAVNLICSVLALGALTLNEVDVQRLGSPIDGSQLSLFGLGLGFYGTSLRLSAYTHDSIEAMLTFFFMGVFAVYSTDFREAFRRLQQFETQAISLNLALYLEGKDPRLVHDPELWPQTSNLIIFEMAKRAWSMFKVYIINVFLALGRRSSCYEIGIESPTPVDDELLDIGASTIEDYGKAPTPVAFILALEELSTIAHSYAQLVNPHKDQSRFTLKNGYQGLREKLKMWELKVPSFLHWGKPSTVRLPSWVKIQRAHLWNQYNCVAMKLFWSIGALEPAQLVARRPESDDAYTPCYEAAGRVLEVAKESTTFNSIDRILYHADAIRATTVLLQILLRKTTMDRTLLEKFVVSCRDGIAVCRSLVPNVLSRAEEKFEFLITQHLEHIESLAPANNSPRVNIPLSDVTWGDNSNIYSLFEVPLLEDPLFPALPFYSGADFNFGNI